MDSTHLHELIELDERYWWHVAKRKLLLKILASDFPPPGRVVEGGFGSARNLQELQKLGYHVTGLDILPDAVEHALESGLRDVHLQDLAAEWPLDPGTADVVLLLDVIEHLEDPIAVLRTAANALKSGGGAIVTVPACPWLYSDWDRGLGHYRRYTKRLLKHHAREAGLSVEWATHWNSFSLPPALVLRTIRKFQRGGSTEFPRVPPWLNRLLLGCASVERWWLLRFGMPIGLSLVGVLTK